MADSHTPWWKDATVYQIYPASFKDSNNDGIGDLRGIISKLDYIKALGVDTIWVCPMYESPQIDMGYDISDYQKVYAPYGAVEDMETLIQQCHDRGMKILLDLVINHTSDQHAWFKEARSSKDNPKRDWYIWKPATYDKPGNRKLPNNWRSNFGGSVWEWDDKTQEYYLHLFAREQPDLNWDNEEARKAIYQEAMVFWLDKGVDGFRVDTVNMYSKPPGFPDAPVTDVGAELQEAGKMYVNGPKMDEFLGEMNEILAGYDAVTVGECPHTPDMVRVLRYVSAKEKQLNMVFQFDIVDVGMGTAFKYQTTPRNWKLTQLKDAVARTQSLIKGSDGWTTAFMENHDQARCISRYGDDSPEYRVRSGKMLALLNTALSGTLFIYQGQELGMINLPLDFPMEDYEDLESKNYYRMIAERSGNDPEELKKAHAALQHLARDHARAPMQWTSEMPEGGFTGPGVSPWMNLNPYTKEINVARQIDDPASVLTFWKHMLKIRKEHNALFAHGDFGVVDYENQHVFSFTKERAGQKALVVCNFSGGERAMPEIEGAKELLVGNVDGSREEVLEAWEGRIYLLR